MTRSLEVDRSELADTTQPDQLADLLIQQLIPQLPQLLPLPIEEVAKACGIVEIQPLDTDAFEGGLIQDENKVRGFVLVKAGALPERTRFTIAHELGHFVNLRHVAPPGEARLLCNALDLKYRGVQGDYRRGMEAQANEFAAHLLMPARVLRAQPFLSGTVDLERIFALQRMCNVSKQAAARRYAELHGGDFAVVFTKDGQLARAPLRSGDFPWLSLKTGQAVHRNSLTRTFVGSDGDVSDQVETDAAWWLDSGSEADEWSIWEEVLVQRDGYRMTLLLAERSSDSYKQHRERWTPTFR